MFTLFFCFFSFLSNFEGRVGGWFVVNEHWDLIEFKLKKSRHSSLTLCAWTKILKLRLKDLVVGEYWNLTKFKLQTHHSHVVCAWNKMPSVSLFTWCYLWNLQISNTSFFFLFFFLCKMLVNTKSLILYSNLNLDLNIS